MIELGVCHGYCWFCDGDSGPERRFQAIGIEVGGEFGDFRRWLIGVVEASDSGFSKKLVEFGVFGFSEEGAFGRFLSFEMAV